MSQDRLTDLAKGAATLARQQESNFLFLRFGTLDLRSGQMESHFACLVVVVYSRPLICQEALKMEDALYQGPAARVIQA